MMKLFSDPSNRTPRGDGRFLGVGIKLAMSGLGDGQARHRRSFNGLINALAVSAFIWVMILGLFAFI